MKQKDIALYTSGPVGLQLAKMTGFVMVFGMVAIMAASLAETVYISFLGTEELAALGFAFPIVMLIQSTTMGLSVGASSVVSRRFGEGKRDQGGWLQPFAWLFGSTFIFANNCYRLPHPFVRIWLSWG